MQAAPIVGVRLMAVMLCQTQQSMAAVLPETTTVLCERMRVLYRCFYKY